MAAFTNMMKKGTGGLKKDLFNLIDSVKAEMPVALSTTQDSQCYSSDEEGAAAVVDASFIANGRRGVLVFKEVQSQAVGATKKFRTLHVNFRNESVQVYGGHSPRNYYCKDMINVRRVARDTIYFETKTSRILNPKIYKFGKKADADRFVAYIKSIVAYGQVIWESFDQIDFRKAGQITGVDLREAFVAHDVPFDEEALHGVMGLAAGSDGFGFTEFADNIVNCAVYSLRDCLLELLFKVEVNADRVMRARRPVEATAAVEASSGALLESDSNAVISFADEDSKDAITGVGETESFPLLVGEELFIKASSVRWVLCGDERSPTRSGLGELTITNYRVTLTPNRRGLTSHRGSMHYRPPFFDHFTFPLLSILKVTLTPRPQSILQNAVLEIKTKDCKSLKLTSLKTSYDTYPALEQMHAALRKSISHEKASRLFCFHYRTAFPLDGWIYSDVMVDYSRMGVTESPEWQIVDNTNGQICKSYPGYIVVPYSISTDNVVDAANHRAQCRVPALCYLHHSSSAAIVRSSQPKTGLGETVCHSDVALLDAFRRSGSFNSAREADRPAKFYVFDARGKLSVMANKTIGKGTEVAGDYKNTEVLFCNIDNMHVVRNAFENYCDAMFAPANSINDGFHGEVASSGWLFHCGKVLKSAVEVAEKIHFERCSVLVHCSDGWDRTPQIVATAQILLDPHYRTLEGFFTLVEKEWCAFGHKFKDRWDHAESADPNQRSPVFVQWLHIVHSVMEQAGDVFEFNEYLLVFIADHVSSGLFGNFIENTECIRKQQLDVTSKTQSIWSYILSKREQFTNAHYRPYDYPIWPSSDSRHISAWRRYYLRWDVSAHPVASMQDEWFDDWGTGFVGKA